MGYTPDGFIIFATTNGGLVLSALVLQAICYMADVVSRPLRERAIQRDNAEWRTWNAKREAEAADRELSRLVAVYRRAKRQPDDMTTLPNAMLDLCKFWERRGLGGPDAMRAFFFRLDKEDASTNPLQRSCGGITA